MFRSPKDLFRKAALERLASPERLDQFLKVLPKRRWLTLGGLVLLTVFVVLWGFYGSLPIRAEGKGMILRPLSIRTLQASSTGIISSLTLTEGQAIEVGQLLATIDQDSLLKTLDNQRSRLRQFDIEQNAIGAIEDRQDRQELESLERERKLIESQRDRQRTLAEKSLAETQSNLQSRRLLLNQRLATAQRVLDALNLQLRRRRELVKLELLEKDLLAEVEIDTRRAEGEVAAIHVEIGKLKDLDLAARESYEASLSRLSDFEGELLKLKFAQEQVQYRRPQRLALNVGKRLALAQDIEQTQVLLAKGGRIESPVAGQVIEMLVVLGQVVSTGQTIARIETGGSRGVECLAYFKVEDGKTIVPGMSAQVCPDAVERERYGGIRAWVTEVAPFPVSVAAAARKVGGDREARIFLGEESAIEVRLLLTTRADKPSGFAWTSSAGPPHAIGPGHTSSAYVVTEHRAPVSFILPLLKKATGLQ